MAVRSIRCYLTCEGWDMLHVVEAVHGPERCLGSNEEIRQKPLHMGPKVADVGKARCVTPQGSREVRAARTSYALTNSQRHTP